MSPHRRPRQGDLFGSDPPSLQQLAHPAGEGGAPTPDAMPLQRRQLLAWQERVATFQSPLWSGSRVREPEQASLFGAPGGRLGPEPATDPQTLVRALEPLALPAENLSFWRWPQAPHAGPALYLVLDRPPHLNQPLLLYVGETALADRRWKGAHDCKSYLAAYREALAKADLGVNLSIRFWCEAPAATAERRALELALIRRWKPPFNKETRSRWSTPFTTEGDGV